MRAILVLAQPLVNAASLVIQASIHDWLDSVHILTYPGHSGTSIGVAGASPLGSIISDGEERVH